MGTADEVSTFIGPETDVIDLDGLLVVPGFINAHTHPLSVANGWANFRASNPEDPEAIVAEVKAFAEGAREAGLKF